MKDQTINSYPILLDSKAIAKILPHRYPFLLVDRIIYLDLEAGKIIGQKNVSVNEHFFVGHFPEVPIMPGVLILEALAQTGGILIHRKQQTDQIAVLLTVNNAKFRKPVFPGDTLLLHITAIHVGSKGGKVSARAEVNEQVVAEAEIGFALVDKKQL
jgi:3-hydroxyacyl-[acyl-carrier-protein] dehydratase